MIISHQHKFIFVHIVRTGGTSIEKALAPHGTSYAQHMKFYQIKEQFDGFYNIRYDGAHIPRIAFDPALELDDYFKFLFVRNIPSWMVSLWSYNTRNIEPDKTIAFKHAVNNWTKNKPHPPLYGYGYSTTMFDQHRFILDKDGDTIIPDFIGHTETLQEDFDFVCDRVGIPKVELSVTNSYTRQPWQTYFNDELREFVEKHWKKDIELLGVEW